MIARRTEVDRNFESFQRLLVERQSLLREHQGQWVIMRDGGLVEGQYFSTSLAAMEQGMRSFPDGMFSVQQITKDAADLGFYSHALPIVGHQT